MSQDQVHRYKELRLGQLRAYCECVRYRSFTAAAKALGVTHASIWQQIRALERDYGVALLERNGREMRPTEDGSMLLELASEIVNSVDALKDAFDQRRGSIPRLLKIAATPSAIVGELCRPVATFVNLHSSIKIRLETVSLIREMIEMVAAGAADLAVFPRDEVSLAASKWSIETELLCVRPVVLVVPEHHPLARRRRITLADVIQHPLILPKPENPWRQRVEEVLKSAGLLEKLQVLLEVSATQAMRRFASQGLGPALLALPQDDIAFPNTMVHNMSRLLPGEPITIMWRRASAVRPQARLFLDFLRESTLVEGETFLRRMRVGAPSKNR